MRVIDSSCGDLDILLANNNDNFLCANILEDQAQWHDKTKGLSNFIIVTMCKLVIDEWVKVLQFNWNIVY